MEQLALQAKTLLVSALGIIALIPGPDRAGNLRIRGLPGAIITYLGIFLLLAPWITLPFLPQTRYQGGLNTLLKAAGALGIAVGVGLYAVSLVFLLPAFRERFSEFTPSLLVDSGPYAVVRHPIYLSCLLIVAGLYLVRSAALSVLFLPLLWAVLRGVTIYEERRILQPRFGEQYRRYKMRIRPAILGLWGGLLAAIIYLLLAYQTLMPFLPAQ